MSVQVKRDTNGDVLMSRKVPTCLDACQTTRLRFTEAEWQDFLAGVRNGEFDFGEECE